MCRSSYSSFWLTHFPLWVCLVCVKERKSHSAEYIEATKEADGSGCDGPLECQLAELMERWRDEWRTTEEALIHCMRFFFLRHSFFRMIILIPARTSQPRPAALSALRSLSFIKTQSQATNSNKPSTSTLKDGGACRCTLATVCGVKFRLQSACLPILFPVRGTGDCFFFSFLITSRAKKMLFKSNR